MFQKMPLAKTKIYIYLHKSCGNAAMKLLFNVVLGVEIVGCWVLKHEMWKIKINIKHILMLEGSSFLDQSHINFPVEIYFHNSTRFYISWINICYYPNDLTYSLHLQWCKTMTLSLHHYCRLYRPVVRSSLVVISLSVSVSLSCSASVMLPCVSTVCR